MSSWYSEAGNDVIFRDTNTRSWLKLDLKLKAIRERWKQRIGLDPMVAHTFLQISPNWTSARRSSVEIVACFSRSIDRSFSRAVRVWSSSFSVFFARPSRHPGSRLKDRTWNHLGERLFAFSFWSYNIAHLCIVMCTRIYR